MKDVKSINRKWFKLFFVLILILLTSRQAFAHTRNYAWTEIYETLPQGGKEIEGRAALKVEDGSKTNVNEWEYQGEFEYGVTDHWTLAHYERWLTTNQTGVDDNGVPSKDHTNYEGFKFESKYRIGEKGKYWLDPLIYLEWATDPRNHPHENEFEGKLVLAKQIGDFDISYNQIIESEIGKGGRTEHNYSVGVGYEVGYGVHVGGELFGNYWHPGSHKNEISLGPTIRYEGKYFWVTTGVAFALNTHDDDVQARVIVGVPF